MSSRAAWLVALAPACLAGGFVACGPPESFDGLTGGGPLDAAPETDAPSIEPRPDPELAPPRPIAPLSQTWVVGSRPRFVWELAAGATGARVELCRTRVCDGEKKSFDVAGTELALAEDLAPGVWFWRLVSRTPESFGAKASPSWTLRVRGGASGENAPNGSVVDVNGDGRADLLVPIDYGSFIELTALVADRDDSTSFVTKHPDRPLTGISLAIAGPPIATSDIDGDGLSDVVYADTFPGTPPVHVLFTVPGSATATDALDLDRATQPSLPPLDSLPKLGAAGDLDRDGWGDFAISSRTFTVATFGTRSGLGTMQYLLQYAPGLPDAGVADGGSSIPEPLVPLSVIGAFDWNADGFADLALESPDPEGPFFFFNGVAGRQLGFAAPTATGTAAPSAPSIFATGDLDGDGFADLAIVTTLDSKPSVCAVRGAVSFETVGFVCWTPASPAPGFGSSIVVGDVDADGRDEVIVGAGAGIDILTWSADALTPQHVETPFGAELTMILPGRPEPAVWAATRADGSGIAVFKGRERVTTLSPPRDAVRFGSTIR